MPNNLLIVIISVVLAILPAILWGSLFLYPNPEKRSEVIKIFLVGGTMVIPLTVYRLLWGIYPSINLNTLLKPLENKELILKIFDGVGSLTLPMSVLVLFLTVGIVEEILKHIVVRGVDKDQIKSVDDAIEFSIIAALGFAFVENTMYFINIWQSLGSYMLIQVFVFRSIFSTLAHVLFSAVFGYHFGLSLFAKDIYREKKRKSISRRVITRISKITKIKSIEIFEDQQIFVGLVYASILHAVFNVLLELNQVKVLIPFIVLGCVHVLLLILNSKNKVDYK